MRDLDFHTVYLTPLTLGCSVGDDIRPCNEPALRYWPQEYSSSNLQNCDNDRLSMSAAFRSSSLSFSSKRTVMKSFGLFTSLFSSPKIAEQVHSRYINDACQVFCIAPTLPLFSGRNSLIGLRLSALCPKFGRKKKRDASFSVHELWRMQLCCGKAGEGDSPSLTSIPKAGRIVADEKLDWQGVDSGWYVWKRGTSGRNLLPLRESP